MIMLDPDLIFSLAVIGALVMCSAFFSGSETALTAISRARIWRLVMDGNKRAMQVSRLRREKESLIGAILLGNTAVNIGATAFATSVAIRHWGDEGVAYVTVALTVVVLIFGEVLPKTLAIQNAERFSLLVAPLVLLVVRILTPVTYTIRTINRMMLKPFGIDISRSHSLINAADAIRGTIELHHQEGEMVKQDRDMLGSILDLSTIEVGDVMVHRKQAEMIDAGQPVSEIIQQAVTSSHSRIPLWKDQPDNIVGILHVKNLIRTLNELGQSITTQTILDIAVEPWFIPNSTTLKDQLLAFRERRQHFALVVDEYGVLLGIVTLEDIIEEIVGDIDDEHDRGDHPEITRRDGNIYEINGAITIRDLNRQLDWNLPDEDASTLAGLVIYEARRIPDVGAVFEFHGCRFTVLAKQANRISLLQVEKLPESSPTDVTP